MNNMFMKFYNSKDWKKVRNKIFNKCFGICQECGKPGQEVHHIIHLTPHNLDDINITLNEDNLILLCKDCHMKKHQDNRQKRRTTVKKQRLTNNGTTYFDSEGQLHECKRYIVHGAPGAGKTSYVQQHIKEGDLVLDLDLIKYAITMNSNNNNTDNLMNVVFNIRDMIYSMVEKKEVDARNIFIVGMLPKLNQREDLQKRLDGVLIHIDTSYEECIANINNDSRRTDKDIHLQYLHTYFRDYEPGKK